MWLAFPLLVACSGGDGRGTADALDGRSDLGHDHVWHDSLPSLDVPAEDGVADAGDVPRLPAMGMLQFRVRHNLASSGCLVTQSCYMETEDESDTAAWLAQIRAASTMAVLHWDRSIPWLVFAEEPSAGADPVAFYDARLDADILAWIDAFAAHFEQMPVGYLAVSVLSGARNQLAQLRLSAEQDEIAPGAICPDLSPESVFEVELPEGGSASFELGPAWRRFVAYLAHKLEPDYLAVGVEVNMFREACPERWPGLVSLYRDTVDALRTELGSEVRMFATITWSDVLDYSMESCFGEPLPFYPCDGSVLPGEWGEGDPETCYVMDTAAIWDLDEGDRMDLLALSFYPDALTMDPPGADTGEIRVYAAESYGQEDCTFALSTAPYIDPFDALDRVGWTKPIAMAETSARSCVSVAWNADGEDPFVVETPETSDTQAFWLERTLAVAEERDFEFVVQSFLRDYDVLGTWLVSEGVLDAWTFSVVNSWPCSGIYDRDGEAKGRITEIWEAALNARSR